MCDEDIGYGGARPAAAEPAAVKASIDIDDIERGLIEALA
jgi:hypothetical protein